MNMISTVEYEGRIFPNALQIDGVWHYFHPQWKILEAFPDQFKVAIRRSPVRE